MPEFNSFWSLESEATMFTMAYDNRISRKSFTVEEEKKDGDSVASNHHTESVMSEATERDDHSSVGRDKIDSLPKTMVTDERRGRSRKSKRKARRKRGESLERQISQLILGFASNKTWDSVLEVENAPTSTADPTSVEFILQDLDDPSILELVQGTESMAPLGHFDTDELRDSQWQDFGHSDFANHVTTGNGYSTNFDLQLATIAEAVSHRRLSRNLGREADFDEYGDPSLEINLSDGTDNEDGSTQYDNEPSQPDDELGSMSGLSENEFNEGPFARRGAGPSGSFDSWEWQEAHGVSPHARENRSTSPSASNLQERQQPRTKAESEVRDTREFAPSCESNNVGRSHKAADNRQTHQAQQKDVGVIFKTKYEEWSPLMTAEFPFEGIRFSDTLVDPDEFERMGSVDEEGFLIAQVARPVAKSSKVKSSISTRRDVLDPHFERGTIPATVVNRKYVGTAYHYSPDSVADYYPSSGYCGSNRSVDPPGTRDLHHMDDWSESSTIRIAI